MKERLKSKVVWMAILAQVLIIINVFVPDISDTVKALATAVIEICTLIGILNNPTDRNNF